MRGEAPWETRGDKADEACVLGALWSAWLCSAQEEKGGGDGGPRGGRERSDVAKDSGEAGVARGEGTAGTGWRGVGGDAGDGGNVGDAGDVVPGMWASNSARRRAFCSLRAITSCHARAPIECRGLTPKCHARAWLLSAVPGTAHALLGVLYHGMELSGTGLS